MLSLRALLVATFAFFHLAANAVRADLADYLAKADDSFAWKVREQMDSATGTVCDIRLTSQTWHELKWEHNLLLFLPKAASNADTCLLVIEGGSNAKLDAKPGMDSLLYGATLAAKIGAPCAVL